MPGPAPKLPPCGHPPPSYYLSYIRRLRKALITERIKSHYFAQRHETDDREWKQLTRVEKREQRYSWLADRRKGGRQGRLSGIGWVCERVGRNGECGGRNSYTDDDCWRCRKPGGKEARAILDRWFRYSKKVMP